MSKSDKKLAKKEAKQEKKAAKKAAKAEKKAAITPEEKTANQVTWTKSVTAVVCVVAICISSSVAMGKYADAMIESAGKGGSVAAANGEVDSDIGISYEENVDGQGEIIDNPNASVDGTGDADASADVSADGAGTDDTTAAGGNTSSGGSSATQATSTDPTSYNKAQALNYYNTSLQNSFKQKVTIQKSDKIDIALDAMKPNSSVVMDVANKIIKNYATENVTTLSFTNGKDSNGTLASDFGPKTKLTAAGVKSATVKKSGSNYVVTINVVSEKATLSTPPKYNSLCASPLDLATVDLFGVEVNKADFNYPGTVLTATINAKGQVVSSTVTMPLNGTGGAKFLAFNLEATAHGANTVKFTYKY